MSIDALDRLNSKIFSEHLHTQFKVQAGDGTSIGLELFEVLDHDTSPKIELFLLHFHGPKDRLLQQKTHRLEHEALGAMDLFLTPIGSAEQNVEYEAVFHRFRK